MGRNLSDTTPAFASPVQGYPREFGDSATLRRVYPLQRYCVLCGQPETEDAPLSARGKHGDCSVVVVAANIEQMREKDGPFHRHWATRLATRVAEPFLDEANEAG
jgi:hypothetical protein